MWLVAVMAVTGAWYFIEVAGVSPDYPEPPVMAATAPSHLDLDQALARPRTRGPALRLRHVALPGDYPGSVYDITEQADALQDARARPGRTLGTAAVAPSVLCPHLSARLAH